MLRAIGGRNWLLLEVGLGLNQLFIAGDLFQMRLTELDGGEAPWFDFRVASKFVLGALVLAGFAQDFLR